MNENRGAKGAFKASDLTYIAFGAAIIAVCSYISVPASIPFTMQTFAVFFVLSALGGKRGTLSVVLYIALGAAGLPVFAGFTSGIGVLFGDTGGYIVGFVFTGIIYRLLVGAFGKKLWAEVTALLLGLAVLYAFGTVWYVVFYAGGSGAVGLAAAFMRCVAPFVLPDLLKLATALVLARRVSPLIKA